MTTHAKTSAASARPVRQLAATVALLAIHIVVALLVIAGVRLVFDRRLDATVYRDVAQKVDAALRDRTAFEAEGWLLEAAARRPRIAVQLGQRYADYLPVMPRFAHVLGTVSGDSASRVASPR